MFENRREFFVRQHAALLKLTGAYDIIDPQTQQVIGTAVEVPPTWAKYARLMVNKALLPTAVHLKSNGSDRPILSLRKSPGFFTNSVTVTDGNGKELGSFKSKAFSLGGRFSLVGPGGAQLGEVQGNWKGWDFTFKDAKGKELGKVTKKWAGLGKELFTTADSYMIALNENVGANTGLAALLLAAGLAVDLVFKESSN